MNSNEEKWISLIKGRGASGRRNWKREERKKGRKEIRGKEDKHGATKRSIMLNEYSDLLSIYNIKIKDLSKS